MRFVVIRTVKAGQRVHRQARLAVTDVPEKTDSSAVMTALETAGKATDFADAGIPWGNHEVKVDKQIPKGTLGVDEVPVVRWEELTDTKTELRRITLRLEPADYDRIHQAARRTGTSIQAWCVNALRAASQPDK